MSSPQASLLSGRRFAICVAVVFVCWDVRPIFNLVWGTPPLRWLMEYVDPRHPSNDPLHGEACLPLRNVWTWPRRSTLLEAMQPLRPLLSPEPVKIPESIMSRSPTGMLGQGAPAGGRVRPSRAASLCPAHDSLIFALRQALTYVCGVQSGTSAHPWTGTCGSTAWRAPSCTQLQRAGSSAWTACLCARV